MAPFAWNMLFSVFDGFSDSYLVRNLVRVVFGFHAATKHKSRQWRLVESLNVDAPRPEQRFGAQRRRGLALRRPPSRPARGHGASARAGAAMTDGSRVSFLTRSGDEVMGGSELMMRPKH